MNLLIVEGKKMKKIPALRDETNGRLIHDPMKLSSILNKHFASCGSTLAAKLPHSERHFSEFLVNSPMTFYFVQVPVTPGEVESEISIAIIFEQVLWSLFVPC